MVDSFPRMHGLVIGPGLGRDPKVHKIVGKIIQEARKKELPYVSHLFSAFDICLCVRFKSYNAVVSSMYRLVIDGDGLFLVENQLHTVIGYDK